MKKNEFKAGFFQFKPKFGRINENLEHVLKVLLKIESDLIILPELPFTGYYFKDREEVSTLAHEIDNSFIIKELENICKKRELHIVTGFAEKRKDKLFNSSLLIGPGGLISIYRKIHLFNLEKNWFDPGDTQLSVQEIKNVKIGIMICWDWIYPEVARKLTVMGADIICHPSNLVLPYCQYTMVSRSIENHVFTITANRIGMDKRPHGSLQFTGKSQITNPKGNIIHRAKSNKEDLALFVLDINEARNKSMTSTNELLNDRRPEFY